MEDPSPIFMSVAYCFITETWQVSDVEGNLDILTEQELFSDPKYRLSFRWLLSKVVFEEDSDISAPDAVLTASPSVATSTKITRNDTESHGPAGSDLEWAPSPSVATSTATTQSDMESFYPASGNQKWIKSSFNATPTEMTFHDTGSLFPTGPMFEFARDPLITSSIEATRNGADILRAASSDRDWAVNPFMEQRIDRVEIEELDNTFPLSATPCPKRRRTAPKDKSETPSSRHTPTPSSHGQISRSAIQKVGTRMSRHRNGFAIFTPEKMRKLETVR